MTTTSTRVTFGLFNLGVKQDATFSTVSDLQSFSKLTDLENNNIASRPYITYEPNMWLLNGNYKFMPTDAQLHVGFMSLDMSDDSGVFATPPVLTAIFSQDQDTNGLTLRFSPNTGDWSNNIVVTYYDFSDAIIRTDVYLPNAAEFVIAQDVDNFRKIKIVFNSTNKPRRYMRLVGIDFGELLSFTGNEIVEAKIIQEVNPLSLDLPSSNLDLVIHSENSDFSIVKPDSLYVEILDNQPLDVYQSVGGIEVYLGQFYLTDWRNETSKITRFKAIDRLGILDGLAFLGYLFIIPEPLNGLIESMFGLINTPYELDPELENLEITGWLPPSTYREALQQIAFRVGAYVTCSGTGIIRILKSDLVVEDSSYTATLTKAELALESTLELRPLVTGVEVYSHTFVEDDQTSGETTDGRKVFDGTLAVGQHTIIFDRPVVYDNLTLIGGGLTKLSGNSNYVVVNVTIAGAKVIYSRTDYVDSQTLFTVNNPSISNSTPKNIITIKTALLVDVSVAQSMAQRVFDYYNQRYLQKSRLITPSIEPMQSVLIESDFSQQIVGKVEKMEIDLDAGFLVDTDIIGIKL